MKIDTPRHFSVGDILRAESPSGGFRVWRVTGADPAGNPGREELIFLQSLDRWNGDGMSVCNDILQIAIQNGMHHIPMELPDLPPDPPPRPETEASCEKGRPPFDEIIEQVKAEYHENNENSNWIFQRLIELAQGAR